MCQRNECLHQKLPFMLELSGKATPQIYLCFVGKDMGLVVKTKASELRHLGFSIRLVVKMADSTG